MGVKLAYVKAAAQRYFKLAGLTSMLRWLKDLKNRSYQAIKEI